MASKRLSRVACVIAVAVAMHAFAGTVADANPVGVVSALVPRSLVASCPQVEALLSSPGWTWTALNESAEAWNAAECSALATHGAQGSVWHVVACAVSGEGAVCGNAYTVPVPIAVSVSALRARGVYESRASAAADGLAAISEIELASRTGTTATSAILSRIFSRTFVKGALGMLLLVFVFGNLAWGVETQWGGCARRRFLRRASQQGGSSVHAGGSSAGSVVRRHKSMSDVVEEVQELHRDKPSAFSHGYTAGVPRAMLWAALLFLGHDQLPLRSRHSIILVTVMTAMSVTITAFFTALVTVAMDHTTGDGNALAGNAMVGLGAAAALAVRATDAELVFGACGSQWDPPAPHEAANASDLLGCTWSPPGPPATLAFLEDAALRSASTTRRTTRAAADEVLSVFSTRAGRIEVTPMSLNATTAARARELASAVSACAVDTVRAINSMWPVAGSVVATHSASDSNAFVSATPGAFRRFRQDLAGSERSLVHRAAERFPRDGLDFDLSVDAIASVAGVSAACVLAFAVWRILRAKTNGFKQAPWSPEYRAPEVRRITRTTSSVTRRRTRAGESSAPGTGGVNDDDIIVAVADGAATTPRTSRPPLPGKRGGSLKASASARRTAEVMMMAAKKARRPGSSVAGEGGGGDGTMSTASSGASKDARRSVAENVLTVLQLLREIKATQVMGQRA